MTEHAEKILVVEDDASVAMGLVHNLKYEGFDVTLAPDGEAGLRLACDTRPDLILLDVMMPKMNGFEVLAELRRVGLDMQVLMLTARGTEEDKVRGLGLGADDYITKPFSLRELIARVNSSLRRVRQQREAADAKPLAFGDVVIDPRGRKVSKGGLDRPLSSREFDLLLFLARNPERAFSREELLRSVWGWNYEGTDRTVDNFMRVLRASLEDDPSHPVHFRTVFGIGYSFNP